MNRILSVIVLYNNIEEVKQFVINSISASGNTIDFIIVNNGNRIDEHNSIYDTLFADYKNSIRIVDFKENVGYLNALLKVIQLTDINLYSYFILSNTDIGYITDNFYDVLLSKKYDADIGCIAPSVYALATSSYSNPHYVKRIPKEKFIFLSRLFVYPNLAKLYMKLGAIKAKVRKNVEQSAQYVYSPHGCFFILLPGFIKILLGKTYGVKMYSEESFIGEELRLCGLRCFYDPDLKIEHFESSVTGTINYKKRFRLWKESLDYILENYYSNE